MCACEYLPEYLAGKKRRRRVLHRNELNMIVCVCECEGAKSVTKKNILRLHTHHTRVFYR